MYGSKWIRIGAISGAISVSVGALGAHLVKTSLQAKIEAATLNVEDMVKILDNWSTATEYMMYHSIAIVLVGLVSTHLCSRFLTWAGSFFTVGILGFSVGLLLFNLIQITSGTKVLILVAAVVPLGGVCYILGWVCLATALWTGTACQFNQDKSN